MEYILVQNGHRSWYIDDIEKATEKGYKVGVERMPGDTMTTMKIYKETDYKKEER